MVAAGHASDYAGTYKESVTSQTNVWAGEPYGETEFEAIWPGARTDIVCSNATRTCPDGTTLVRPNKDRGCRYDDCPKQPGTAPLGACAADTHGVSGAVSRAVAAASSDTVCVARTPEAVTDYIGSTSPGGGTGKAQQLTECDFGAALQCQRRRNDKRLATSAAEVTAAAAAALWLYRRVIGVAPGLVAVALVPAALAGTLLLHYDYAPGCLLGASSSPFLLPPLPACFVDEMYLELELLLPSALSYGGLYDPQKGVVDCTALGFEGWPDTAGFGAAYLSERFSVDETERGRGVGEFLSHAAAQLADWLVTSEWLRLASPGYGSAVARFQSLPGGRDAILSGQYPSCFIVRATALLPALIVLFVALELGALLVSMAVQAGLALFVYLDSTLGLVADMTAFSD